MVCRKGRQVAVGGETDRARGKAGNKAGEGAAWEEAVKEFVEGKWCRREVLDRVIDGRLDRNGYEEDEAACDVCARRH